MFNKRLTILGLFLVPMTSQAATSGFHHVVQQQTQPAATTVNFNALASQCAKGVHPETMQAIVRVESKFNPYAIGVVAGALKRQPRTHAEAVAAANMLHAQGRNFSMGLAQVNRHNLKHYGLTYETVFDPCKNLNAGAKILAECFSRAEGGKATQSALQKAFSCYYSGNFRFGFTQDFKGQPSYVQKVLNSAALNSPTASVKVPAVSPSQTMIKPVAYQAPKKKAAPKPQSSQTVTAQPAQAMIVDQQPTSEPPKKAANSWDVFAQF
ncbi:MAG: lytic transglycosylase domain-containing protein [Neisseria sp.]